MVLRESDPSEIGGYPIDDRLGSGGMGVVFLARSASGRRLAIKVVHGQYADDPEFRTRFRREVDAARQVSGAFTAPVVDADAGAPRPWMATLYIPGENLGTHVRREGPLPLDRLLELAAGLTEALRDIHRVGMVHRDLKPANVMLADDGPRVIDFGVSRAAEALAGDALTQTGRVMGTPPYMSPEQLTRPREVGPPSDVFSLGAVLVHAATGRGPFDSASPYETATRVVEGDPELDRVPEELLPFVEQCLAKHPKSRPTPDDLLALLRGEPLPPPSPEPEPEPEPEPKTEPEPEPKTEPESEAPAPHRRRRRLLIGAAVGGVLLAVLGAGTVVRLATSDEAGRSDVPDGWRAWQAKDKGNAQDAVGPFASCAAVSRGLVCAGSDVKAARFSLATGDVAWSKPIDPTPDGQSSEEGDVIGSAGRRVFVYRNNEIVRGHDDEAVADYAIQAVDGTTGRVFWTAPTGKGPEVNAPDPDLEAGAAAATDDGILTLTGPRGRSYALIDADDGERLWQRPVPEGQDCQVREAAGHGYLVCSMLDSDSDATRIARLDPATGKPRWSVTENGALSLVGQSDGRLLLAAADGTTHRRIITLGAQRHDRRTVRLAHSQDGIAKVTLSRGTLYFVLPNGSVRAVDPRSGRLSWDRNSTVELPGPPLASATHLYLASPSGRVAALDRETGEVSWTRAGRASEPVRFSGMEGGASPILVGDALYVPYGVRSVYSVDVRNP
ncbi:serine/threonine-protein kinase [Streptomyces sp. NPDC048441]|uniref:serine/threonine-protein kinase n=1 Tax=Streptomyces sp. NPDC048441 TaxID=3365552 RepID=UPI00371562BB